jgi:enamine deaminase RidA (YjgF/YER057c/UK114 family)
MAEVKPIAPVRIGGTDIHYAQGMRAGPWLFFTGHMATDFEHGLAASVAGKPALPLGGAPRYRREGDFIINRFAKLIAAEGGDLRHIVRVDQYYPSAQVVNAYQRARKLVLKDYVPPSTSVLMEELLLGGANMDVSMLAVLPGDGREPKAAKVVGVPVPPHSGFIPSLVMGDYVFVAGQMPNNVEMTGLEPPAYRPPNAVWNGTDIRLQTEFLITGRLKPALEGGGSSLKNAIKAQVYLTNIEDLPEFIDVWNSHFGASPCALTVVATKGLALLESIIEINIFGVRDAAATKKQIIDHKPSQHMRLGPAAVRAGDLLCLSALYAADEDGALPAARNTASLRYFGAPVQHQMRTILGAAEEICRTSGASLANLVRAHHFVSDLNVVYPALRVWQDKLAGAPIPFGAVRPPAMPIPGCDVILDAWVYQA